MSGRKKSVDSTESQILAVVRGHGEAWVFSPSDFLQIADRQVIDVALHRLARRGVIRRVARGLYDVPREHPVLGTLSTSIEDAVRAIARRDSIRVQPAGAYAANLLGLSTQVPAKILYLTDGPSKTIKVGTTIIQFRRTTPKNMEAAGRLSGLLIQALRELRQENVTPEVVFRLKRTIPSSERSELPKDLRLAPAWMHPIFRALAESS